MFTAKEEKFYHSTVMCVTADVSTLSSWLLHCICFLSHPVMKSRARKNISWYSALCFVWKVQHSVHFAAAAAAAAAAATTGSGNSSTK
jgi:hypothetical protein